MLNYKIIDALYGADLSSVIKPNIPYKLKASHVIIGLVVAGFAAYGVFIAYKKLKDRFEDND
jgi:hypothetical protein